MKPNSKTFYFSELSFDYASHLNYSLESESIPQLGLLKANTVQAINSIIPELARVVVDDHSPFKPIRSNVPPPSQYRSGTSIISIDNSYTLIDEQKTYYDSLNFQCGVEVNGNSVDIQLILLDLYKEFSGDPIVEDLLGPTANVDVALRIEITEFVTPRTQYSIKNIHLDFNPSQISLVPWPSIVKNTYPTILSAFEHSRLFCRGIID